ncbi:MAG: Wzz/FepE/Etk N-terminal domain-containing protein [bacterium]
MEINTNRLDSFLWVVARGWSLFFGIIFFSLLFAFILAFSLPKEYTATASILPSEGGTSSLSFFLKGLFPEYTTSTGELTSTLFPDILRSRTVLEKVFEKKYRFRKSRKEVEANLYEVFGWKNIDNALKLYGDKIKIRTSIESGTIWISCKTRYPELSAAIVNELILQLDDFNRNKLKSKAKDNVEYLEKRLDEVRQELVEAEDSLASFLSRHRDYQRAASPDVEIELERLKRQREIKSQSYILLSQQYEIAKLEAKKDVPIVSVLDWASVPKIKSGPRRSVIILVVFFLSLIVSTVVTFSTDSTRKNKGLNYSSPVEFLYAELKQTLLYFLRKLSLKKNEKNI